jgi:hypothetical protein
MNHKHVHSALKALEKHLHMHEKHDKKMEHKMEKKVAHKMEKKEHHRRGK